MSAELDAREFVSAMGLLQGAVRNAAHQTLVSGVKAAHMSAKTTDLFKDGPDAKLRGTIVMGIPEPFAGFVKAGDATVKYARFVESGTPPHDIRPKNGEALRFTVNGETLYRRVVHHPGTAARPFMHRAAVVGQQTLDYGLEVFLAPVIANFNSG